MSRATSTTVGVLVGGAVGAIAALLLAPKRGEEMRSDLMRGHAKRSTKAADRIRRQAQRCINLGDPAAMSESTS